MIRKRTKDSSSNVVITFKCSRAFAEMIEHYMTKFGYLSRSEFIRDAIRFFIVAKSEELLREVREEGSNGRVIYVVDLGKLEKRKRR